MPDKPLESALSLPILEGIEDRQALRGSALGEEIIQLFDQLRDRLLRYALSFGLPIADAEDIVQEVFLSLCRHLQRGRPRDNLRAWTFRVAHNLAIKRRIQLQSLLERTVDDAGVPEDLLRDPGPNPEDELAASQRRLRMSAVVNALPELDRRCLILRAEGLKYREITHVLDISMGAVAISLERSLERLARALRR
ncbi:MAG: sigma-70 family RNA polymerase sigma factor [Acidobacteriia bacterium]|nr:sigma-70 family RNA polymerase sigma factor [Terriglobia bacterium]